jgi:hypothetical protein
MVGRGRVQLNVYQSFGALIGVKDRLAMPARNCQPTLSPFEPVTLAGDDPRLIALV